MGSRDSGKEDVNEEILTRVTRIEQQMNETLVVLKGDPNSSSGSRGAEGLLLRVERVEEVVKTIGLVWSMFKVFIVVWAASLATMAWKVFAK